MRSTWEGIHANWINGNKSTARDKLLELSKREMLYIIWEALTGFPQDLNTLINLLNFSRIYPK